MDLIACWVVELITQAIQTALLWLETLGTWAHLGISSGQMARDGIPPPHSRLSTQPEAGPCGPSPLSDEICWDSVIGWEVCPGFATTCSVAAEHSCFGPQSPHLYKVIWLLPSLHLWQPLKRTVLLPYTQQQSHSEGQTEKGKPTSGHCLRPGPRADF